ncbi:MAG: YqiA/YcfP family alpha/beta fold hydrolase [Candidatus Cryptobacteroides sp.]|jgi:predicted esterase YcpF (UPF0227 family)|nr:YqiA/YcfP family alpha/beta fold hydrolase [Candidatus Cryptobacteroides sp.]
MKILFIHGLASSGAYKMATSLRILLKDTEVIAPDVPIRLQDAINLLEDICLRENPGLTIGLSWGGFLAQKLRGRRKMLINPDLGISRMLRTKIGEQKYLSPRKNGEKTFTITEGICNEYAEAEISQYASLTQEEVSMTTGIFALNDELVHCGPEFELHYPGQAHYYPGGHLPNYPEIKKHILPILRKEMDR